MVCSRRPSCDDGFAGRAKSPRVLFWTATGGGSQRRGGQHSLWRAQPKVLSWTGRLVQRRQADNHGKKGQVKGARSLGRCARRGMEVWEARSPCGREVLRAISWSEQGGVIASMEAVKEVLRTTLEEIHMVACGIVSKKPVLAPIKMARML